MVADRVNAMNGVNKVLVLFKYHVDAEAARSEASARSEAKGREATRDKVNMNSLKQSDSKATAIYLLTS